MNEQCRRVWLSEKCKIASFHAMEGYQMRFFYCDDHFLRFMQELEACGFRFQ